MNVGGRSLPSSASAGRAVADSFAASPTPPCGSPSWWRGCARRSALERTNSRINDGFRFERHSIRGKDKMTARVGLALGSVRTKVRGRLRSLIRPPPAQAAGRPSRTLPRTDRSHPGRALARVPEKRGKLAPNPPSKHSKTARNGEATPFGAPPRPENPTVECSANQKARKKPTAQVPHFCFGLTGTRNCGVVAIPFERCKINPVRRVARLSTVWPLRR